MSYWEVFHLVQTLSHSLFASHLTEGFTEPDELVGPILACNSAASPDSTGLFCVGSVCPSIRTVLNHAIFA
jgi:hypothetical protein